MGRGGERLCPGRAGNAAATAAAGHDGGRRQLRLRRRRNSNRAEGGKIIESRGFLNRKLCVDVSVDGFIKREPLRGVSVRWRNGRRNAMGTTKRSLLAFSPAYHVNM